MTPIIRETAERWAQDDTYHSRKRRMPRSMTGLSRMADLSGWQNYGWQDHGWSELYEPRVILSAVSRRRTESKDSYPRDAPAASKPSPGKPHSHFHQTATSKGWELARQPQGFILVLESGPVTKVPESVLFVQVFCAVPFSCGLQSVVGRIL